MSKLFKWYFSISNIYTELPNPIPKNLELTVKYDSSKYVVYDNYSAINIPTFKDIPIDYDDIMGVPITYLQHHNSNLFQIVGFSGFKNNYKFHTKFYENPKQHNTDGRVINGSKLNTNTVIAYDTPPINKTYYTAASTDKYLVMQFTRIFIKKK